MRLSFYIFVFLERVAKRPDQTGAGSLIALTDYPIALPVIETQMTIKKRTKMWGKGDNGIKIERVNW